MRDRDNRFWQAVRRSDEFVEQWLPFGTAGEPRAQEWPDLPKDVRRDHLRWNVGVAVLAIVVATPVVIVVSLQTDLPGWVLAVVNLALIVCLLFLDDRRRRRLLRERAASFEHGGDEVSR